MSMRPTPEGMNPEIDTLNRIIEALRKQVATLEKDAKRYQYLRDLGLYELRYKDHGGGPEYNSGELLDREIDLLMEKSK